MRAATAGVMGRDSWSSFFPPPLAACVLTGITPWRVQQECESPDGSRSQHQPEVRSNPLNTRRSASVCADFTQQFCVVSVLKVVRAGVPWNDSLVLFGGFLPLQLCPYCQHFNYIRNFCSFQEQIKQISVGLTSQNNNENSPGQGCADIYNWPPSCNFFKAQNSPGATFSMCAPSSLQNVKPFT